MKLDGKTVAALGLDDKADVIHFDDAMPGFGYRLRAGAGGKVLRSWVVQYRRAGATRRITLDGVLGAEQARIAAKKLLASVALGGDPAGERDDRRDKDRLSFRSVVDEYLVLAEKRLRPRSLVETRRYLTGNYFKPLHAMAIDRIGRKDVAARLVSITTKSGGPTASRAKAVLSAMFTWAMKSGLVEANVVIATPEPADSVPRERVLSDDELVAIWRSSGDEDYGRIIRLLVLTGCRRAEIGGMSWSEFDAGDNWTLPAARSKNGKALRLPLPSMAWQIIDSVPHMAGRDQLFGVRAADGFHGWHHGKTALDVRCGVADWRVHDIRRTVATGMADVGIQPHIIETILNHASGHKRGPAGIYNRSVYEHDVRAALAMWADHVRALVDGGERKVLPFPA